MGQGPACKKKELEKMDIYSENFNETSIFSRKKKRKEKPLEGFEVRQRLTRLMVDEKKMSSR